MFKDARRSFSDYMLFNLNLITSRVLSCVLFNFVLISLKIYSAKAISSSVAGQHSSFKSRNSHGMRTFDEVIHLYNFNLIGV